MRESLVNDIRQNIGDHGPRCLAFQAEETYELRRILAFLIEPSFVLDRTDFGIPQTIDNICHIDEPSTLAHFGRQSVAVMERAGNLYRISEAEDELNLGVQLSQDLLP